jgi:hypothetical protein
MSAVKRVEFVSDRMSYVIRRGRWYHIIILDVYAPTEDKTDYVEDSFYEESKLVLDKFPKYHIKILSGDLIATVGRKDIFKPTIGNESLHESNNDNGLRLVNFATSKNLKVKSTMFPDGKTCYEIDHILLDKRRHSNILDVRSYRAENCGTDHSLVVAKVRERLTVNKKTTQISYGEVQSQAVKRGRGVKSNIVLRSRIDLQLWKIWTQR